MHHIQEKILRLIDTEDVSDLSLRDIAGKIGETGSPQKIKHHINQLAKKGFIKINPKDKRIQKIDNGMNKESNVISLPILGSANCGQALVFAENNIKGYLKVTKGILGDLIQDIADLFVLRAVGSSMTRSNILNNSIEDGDYVIVNKKNYTPKSGDYVVSIIDGVANIKKLFIDYKNNQIILLSESNQDIAPMYIHENDLDDYLIAGQVVLVMKEPENLDDFMNISASDILKDLGHMSKEEHDYYMNL
ncbi:hypothetical protein KKG22_00610 [Patescibacteria group bacterium]|nr:hypothetical protein [Patescibacteria group bacterium]MBU1721498.1 hypothetical protein [Patescibacteria group bacterium]MBU1900930.1 hypothetical protein [Patescibacteria group bacterium]